MCRVTYLFLLFCGWWSKLTFQASFPLLIDGLIPCLLVFSRTIFRGHKLVALCQAGFLVVSTVVVNLNIAHILPDWGVIKLKA